MADDLFELRNTKLPRHHRDAEHEMRWAADEIAKLRAALREIEFINVPHGRGASSSECAYCGEIRDLGHTPDCLIGKALRP